VSRATPALSAEALRQAALDALGPYADARARAALQDAHVRVEPAVTAWESSAGRVEGHRVTLAVDAATLARLRVVPALEDALHSALAAAISAQPGQALAAVALVWAREGARARPDGYRDRPPPPPQTLEEALASYLDARGEPALARFVAAARVEARPGTVTFTPAPGASRAAGAAALEALTAAARDLLGDAEARVVVAP
jgi:hypothetical protein